MPSYPAVDLSLWSEDAIVLFDWLQTVDFDQIPADHKAVKLALTDLLSRLEEIVPYRFDLSGTRIEEARHEVSKDMEW